MNAPSTLEGAMSHKMGNGQELSCPHRKALCIKVVILLLLYKALVLGIAFYCAAICPGFFSVENYQANFHRQSQPSFAERFSTWDGEHYLSLSQDGYHAGSPSAAFYPLWPSVIRLCSEVLGGRLLIVSLAVANLFSFVAWIFFHRLVERQYGMRVANLSLAMLLAYPGALFFQFPYSESLFFLLIVLFFSSLFEQKYWLTASCGFLLPLTRATGIFCLLPLCWHIWAHHRPGLGNMPTFRRICCNKRKVAIWVPILAAPMLGYVAYFGIMAALTGNAVEGFKAQENYVNHPSILNIVDVQGFLMSVINVSADHSMRSSPVDRIMFFVFVSCLPFLWRFNRTYFWYALAAGLVPAISNRFFSYTRLLLLCFPVFIALSIILLEVPRRRYLPYVFACLIGMQIGFVIRHVNFYWAG
jgi:hypothetical protein